MRAGNYNERIEIFRASTTKSTVGSLNSQWVSVMVTHASVRYNSGNRNVAESEVYYPTNKTFVMRAYVPIEEFDRILFQGHYYEILSIDHRREFNDIEVQTRQVNE